MSFSATKGYQTKPKPGVMLNPLHPLSRGLVGYWLFNEGSGSRAYDISGHGNHGTLVNGPTWGGSKFGGGLHFDGANDYVDCGGDIIGTGAYTKVAWVKRDDAAEKNNIISGNSTHAFWAPYIAGYTFKLSSGHNSTWNYVQDSVQLPHGTWCFAAVTFDPNIASGTMKLYKNGKLVDSATSVPTQTLDTKTYVASFGSGHCLAGSIDDPHIYNRALAAWEIETLYHNPFCNVLRVPIRRYYVPPVVGGHPTIRRWGGIPGMQYTGRRSW